LTPLQKGADALTQAAQRYDAAAKKINDNGLAGASPEALRALNQMLFNTERVFLSEKGLPNRPWFKHQIYAPGAYTGYAVKTIPAVRESLEQRQWAQAEEGTKTVGEILTKEADLVNQAADALEKLTAGR
jgi:N-acetylated-alpha-linked acidic dipeptidase